METVQIVLDKKLLQATDRAARRTKRNRSELVREALREHLRRLEVCALEERDRQLIAAVLDSVKAGNPVKNPNPRTIQDAIDEYKATRESSATKLLHRVLDKLIGLHCPHCFKDIPIRIE